MTKKERMIKEMDEQQSQKVKAIDDQQAEGVRGKHPYHTPRLRKLGSAQRVYGQKLCYGGVIINQTLVMAQKCSNSR